MPQLHLNQRSLSVSLLLVKSSANEIDLSVRTALNPRMHMCVSFEVTVLPKNRWYRSCPRLNAMGWYH